MTSDPTNVSNSPGVSASPSPAGAPESTLSCTACPHSLASHDPLGIRFCAATSDRNLDRKCICAGAQANGQHYARY